MLPQKMKLKLFDNLSKKTMRYVTAVSMDDADGVVRDPYEQINQDFFINGSLTSRSRVPDLLAAIWAAGREAIIVPGHLSRTTKEAIAAVMSNINDCPYCGEMLISLVHAGDQHDAAKKIFVDDVDDIADPEFRRQMKWVEQLATLDNPLLPPNPFTKAETVEAIAAMIAMSDINRFSHVVMDGSPVTAPEPLRHTALRMFGVELRSTKKTNAVPGLGMEFLPAAPIPKDLVWASASPVVQMTFARWFATVELVASTVISEEVRDVICRSVNAWNNERMPISRGWVDAELGSLSGRDRAIARLALIVAKASYQFSDDLIEDLGPLRETDLIRILAFASYAAARRLGTIFAERAGLTRASADRIVA